VFRLARRPTLVSIAHPMTALLIATRNGHKAGEIRAILGEGVRYLTLDGFPGAPNVVEDAPTFAGNATKKAVELAKWLSAVNDSRFTIHVSRFFVLADDSGLEVDALNGAPGVHSARFAVLDSSAVVGQASSLSAFPISGPHGLSPRLEACPTNSPDAENIAKLLRLLKDVPLERRTARFRCVIALTPLIRDQVESASPVCYADEFEMQTQLFEAACEGRIGFAPRGQGGFGYDPLFLPDGISQTFAELGEETKNRLSHRGRALAKLKDRLERQSGIARPPGTPG